ncbi:MAG: nucleotidyltransferase domain-containing protein [bacterium]
MKKTKWYREFHDSSILMGYRGSKAHGTFRPSTEKDSIDDIDIMAVIIQPISAYYGFGMKETRKRFEGQWDLVVYDVQKFIYLLCKSNPNVLSLLWIDSNYYLKISPLGQRLIDNRHIFVSKQAYKSFTGYAYSQLHRMTHLACKGYMGDKRKKLVEKYGYDTKNASHLIRLLRMGIEFLSTGQLNVAREDNTHLVEIKKGKFTLKEIKADADRLFKLAEEALVRSTLPDKIDRDAAEELLVSILRDHFGSRYYCEPPE